MIHVPDVRATADWYTSIRIQIEPVQRRGWPNELGIAVIRKQ